LNLSATLPTYLLLWFDGVETQQSSHAAHAQKFGPEVMARMKKVPVVPRLRAGEVRMRDNAGGELDLQLVTAGAARIFLHYHTATSSW